MGGNEEPSLCAELTWFFEGAAVNADKLARKEDYENTNLRW